jgi:hypothetical protein
MAYAPLRKRRSSPGAIADRRSRRRALELLAGCGLEGCTEAVMLANGIDVDTMVEIIVEGLATAYARRSGVTASRSGASRPRPPKRHASCWPPAAAFERASETA